MADKRNLIKVPYNRHSEHESGAFVTFPNDITHAQLELHEAAVADILDGVKRRTPAVLSRAAVTGALTAEIIEKSEGLPTTVKEIPGTSGKILYWFAQQVGGFFMDLKSISPE